MLFRVKPWMALALALAAGARALASPVAVDTARLEGDEDRAALVVAVAGMPQVKLDSKPASRWVVLDFAEASLPAGAQVFGARGGLVEAASLEQVGDHLVRAAVRVARGTHVSVYRGPSAGAPGFCYTVLVLPDSSVSTGVLPVKGRLSSHFGWRMHPILNEVRMHEGIDIAVPSGTPIRSVAEGDVTWAGWKGGAGLCVIVKHPDGVETKYMHCEKILVSEGQHVKRRQVLAKSGETGLTTGPHVHFSITANGKPVDPMRYLLSAGQAGGGRPGRTSSSVRSR